MLFNKSTSKIWGSSLFIFGFVFSETSLSATSNSSGMEVRLNSSVSVVGVQQEEELPKVNYFRVSAPLEILEMLENGLIEAHPSAEQTAVHYQLGKRVGSGPEYFLPMATSVIYRDQKLQDILSEISVENRAPAFENAGVVESQQVTIIGHVANLTPAHKEALSEYQHKNPTLMPFLSHKEGTTSFMMLRPAAAFVAPIIGRNPGDYYISCVPAPISRPHPPLSSEGSPKVSSKDVKTVFTNKPFEKVSVSTGKLPGSKVSKIKDF